MIALINIIVLLILWAIAAQDFRYRAFRWILIPILFTGLVIKSFLITGSGVIISSFVNNIIYICVDLAVLIIYLSIRKGKFERVINTYLGLGDLLFLIAIAPALCLGNFLLFITGSVLLILLSYIFLNILKVKTINSIPLAGIQAIFFGCWIITDWTLNYQLSFNYLPIYFAYY